MMSRALVSMLVLFAACASASAADAAKSADATKTDKEFFAEYLKARSKAVQLMMGGGAAGVALPNVSSPAQQNTGDKQTKNTK